MYQIARGRGIAARDLLVIGSGCKSIKRSQKVSIVTHCSSEFHRGQSANNYKNEVLCGECQYIDYPLSNHLSKLPIFQNVNSVLLGSLLAS